MANHCSSPVFVGFLGNSDCGNCSARCECRCIRKHHFKRWFWKSCMVYPVANRFEHRAHHCMRASCDIHSFALFFHGKAITARAHYRAVPVAHRCCGNCTVCTTSQPDALHRFRHHYCSRSFQYGGSCSFSNAAVVAN